jgi:hypothetical protein
LLHKDIKGIERKGYVGDANKRLRIMIRRVISLQKTDCREPITLTLSLNLHIILHLTLPLTLTAAPTLTLSLKPEVEDEENGFCISVVHGRLTNKNACRLESRRHTTTTPQQEERSETPQESKRESRYTLEEGKERNKT